jgi:hypothetical protein
MFLCVLFVRNKANSGRRGWGEARVTGAAGTDRAKQSQFDRMGNNSQQVAGSEPLPHRTESRKQSQYR